MKKIQYIPVLNVPLFDGSIVDFFKILTDDCESKKKENKQISFCDANVLVSANKNKGIKDILQNETFINMPDGIPGVWIGKLKGASNIQRCYGPDLFEYVMRETSRNSEIKHFFSGGKEGVAEDLKSYCELNLGNYNVVGTHCPPFRDMKDEEIRSIAKDINNSGADILWIGISSPKQDVYAKRLRKYLNISFILTIGAAFDFFTGNVRQAPRILQKSGFEWLFRLIIEPKRLWKRYFRVVPMFIYYNVKELLFVK